MPTVLEKIPQKESKMTGDLPYNLADPTDKLKFEGIIQQWIAQDDATHSKFIAEWKEADAILNGDNIPTGWSEDHQGDLADKNLPTVRPGSTAKMFVNVPRLRPIHEATIGDFITLRRIMNFIPRNNPRATNLARVLRQRVEYIEDTEMVNETVYFPTIDNAISKGLWWIDVSYNPKARNLVGKFDIEEVDVRDVLVDCRSRGYYFNKAERFIRRMQFNLETAKKKFAHHEFFDAETLAYDNEYDTPYESTESSKEEYCTIYKVQFSRLEQRYYQQGENGLIEIPEEEFLGLSNNPQTADQVFAGDEEMCYYTALYNTHVGVFDLQLNKFGLFSLIPAGNVFTGSRLYPIGDVKIYKGMQALLNTLVTVFLENAKRANKGIYDIDQDAYSEYAAQIDKAINEGGAVPGLKGVHYPQSINAALTQMIPWTISWIQDAASKHSASMGELPAKQIAKETVAALMAKDRQSLGRKDIMINYMLTCLVRLLTKMICAFDTEPDFMSLRNERPGQTNYVPINQRWNEKDYLIELTQLSGLEPPDQDDPESMGNYQKNLIAFRKMFESKNDVRVIEVDWFNINGEDFTPEDLSQAIHDKKMTQEEFVSVHGQPVPVKMSVYHVNDLSQPIELTVRYEIDNDFENDPQFRQNRALMLQSRGMMSRLDTLTEMDIPDAQQKIENVDSENSALQMAKIIVSDENLLAAVQQLIQQAGAKENGA